MQGGKNNVKQYIKALLQGGIVVEIFFKNVQFSRNYMTADVVVTELCVCVCGGSIKYSQSMF